MATRPVVPRATGEGGIGTSAKHWGNGYFDNLSLAGEDVADNLSNMDLALAESTGYGIISGCEPTISGLTVTVGAGIVHLADGTRKEIAETNITLDTADSTNPRIDLVYITSTGTVAKVTGTAAASPSAPALPADGIKVCTINVAANANTGVVTDSRGVLARLQKMGIANVKDFGASGNGVADDTAAIQAAINSGAYVILFPRGYYNISAPLIIPKQGMSLLGVGNAVSILQATTDLYPDEGLITFKVGSPGDDTVWGSWGIVIQHLYLKGLNHKMHGVYLRKISYPLLYDVSIDGFDGSGLLLDKCQDGSFENCNIQKCGRVATGGDNTLNSDCESAAIKLFSTVSGDNCNMLRFNKCQIEENNCSPYVTIADGIGFWFDQCHVEDRTGSARYDFLQINGGDVMITDPAVSTTMRNGIIRTGYGTIKVSGGRSIGNIKTSATNKSGNIYLSGVNAGNITIGSYAGNFIIDGCVVGDVKLTYPGGFYSIQASKINDITVSNVGSPAPYINISGCMINSVTKSSSAKIVMTNNIISGNANLSGTNTEFINNIVGGTSTIDVNSSQKYIPHNRLIYRNSKPSSSTWSVGDMCINTEPAAGGYSGWICVTAGTPGTWKGFGAIES